MQKPHVQIQIESVGVFSNGRGNAPLKGACEEGIEIGHNQRCTAFCAAGYVPSVASLECYDTRHPNWTGEVGCQEASCGHLEEVDQSVVAITWLMLMFDYFDYIAIAYR